MGNYQLVMIDMVNNIREIIKGNTELIPSALEIIVPVGIGAIAGLLGFSHLLSYIFRKFKNETIALLTGFIFGSLGILWPWKHSFDIKGAIVPVDKYGAFIDKAGTVIRSIKDSPHIKISGYQQVMPDTMNEVVWTALALALLGILIIWLIEKTAEKTA
jgi:putative membrane protein